jgi:uncharacterized membrane protein YgcG
MIIRAVQARPDRSSRRLRAARWMALMIVLLITSGGTTVAVPALTSISLAPAGADPITNCSTTVGVIVVVDFSHWDQSAQRGCASDPGTGYNALQQAGFTTAGDEHDGPAFICRITDPANGTAYPTPSEDPCVVTPPASAYWSYWHAYQGQNTWTYSQQGAMDYDPPQGSVDAWTFGAGAQPPFQPSAVMATNTSSTSGAPPPTAPPPNGTGTSPPENSATGATSNSTSSGSSAPSAGNAGNASSGGGASTVGTSRSGSTHSGSSEHGSASSSRNSDGTSGKLGSGASGGGSAGGQGQTSGQSSAHIHKIADVSPNDADRRSSSGSPLPFIVGGLAAVALLATGGLIAWRRRRVDTVGDG